MKYVTFILFLSLFFSSCGNHYTETILGIKLGRPVQEQKEIIAGMLLKKKYENAYWGYSEDWEYTILSDTDHLLESYVTIFDCKDNDGNSIVTGVLTAIINPNFHHFIEANPRIKTTPWLQYINEQDVEWVIKMFQNKYGETEVKESPKRRYLLSWHKKNLDIELDIIADKYVNDTFYYRAKARYQFPDDVKKTVCQQAKPVEKF